MSTSAAQVDASAPVLAKIAGAANKGFTGSIEISAKAAGEARQVVVWLHSGKVYAVHSPQFDPPARAWAERALGAPLPPGDGEPEQIAYGVPQSPVKAEMIDAARREWAYGLIAASLTWQRPSIKLRKRQVTDVRKFEGSTWQRIITDISARQEAYERGWAHICSALAAQGKPVGGAHVVAPRVAAVIPGNPTFHDPISLDELASSLGRTRAQLVTEVGRSIASGFPVSFTKVNPTLVSTVLVPEALEDPDHAFAPAVTFADAASSALERDVSQLIPVDMTASEAPAVGGSVHSVFPGEAREPHPGHIDFPADFVVDTPPAQTPLLAQLAMGGNFADVFEKDEALPPPVIAHSHESVHAPSFVSMPEPVPFSMDDFGAPNDRLGALAAPLTDPIPAPSAAAYSPVFEEVSEASGVTTRPSYLDELDVLDSDDSFPSAAPLAPIAEAHDPMLYPAEEGPALQIPANDVVVAPDMEPVVVGDEPSVEVVQDAHFGTPPEAWSPVNVIEAAPLATRQPQELDNVVPPSSRVTDPAMWLGSAASSLDSETVAAVMKRVHSATIQECASLVTERDRAANLARATRLELDRASDEFEQVRYSFEGILRAHEQKRAEHEAALARHEAKRRQTEAVRAQHSAALSAAISSEDRLEDLLAQIAQAQIALEAARVAVEETASAVAIADADLAATTAPAVTWTQSELERFERDSLGPARAAVESSEESLTRLRAQQDAAIATHAELADRVDKAQQLLAVLANN